MRIINEELIQSTPRSVVLSARLGTSDLKDTHAQDH